MLKKINEHYFILNCHRLSSADKSPPSVCVCLCVWTVSFKSSPHCIHAMCTFYDSEPTSFSFKDTRKKKCISSEQSGRHKGFNEGGRIT